MSLTLLKNSGCRPLRSLTPDAAQDMEGATPFAGWSSWGVGGGSDVTQSADWASQGTYSAKIVNATAGAAVARMSGSLGLSTEGFSASAIVRLASLAADNTSARLWFVRGIVGSPYYYIDCMVDKRSGAYYWAMGGYDSGGAYRVTTTVEMQLNTAYEVEIVTHGASWICLKVDGVIVASRQAGGTLFIYSIGIGAFTSTYQGVYTAYVDDIKVYTKILRFSGGIIADDGSWVFCATYQIGHDTPTENTVRCFRSTDEGVTWTNVQSISTALKRSTVYDMTKHGGVLYLVVSRQSYGAPNDYQSDVWRSTDNGASWSLVRAVPTGILQFSYPVMTDGTKIAALLWEVPTSWVDSVVKFVWYDTADDTYAAGATLAAKNDYALATPNESTLYRNGATIAALLRWDDHTLPDQLFVSAQTSADSGVTWSAKAKLTSWGTMGGMIEATEIGGQYWAAGYERLAGDAHKSRVFKFDPATWVKDADEYPMGYPSAGMAEAGNGSLRKAVVYNQLSLTCDAGSSTMYLLEVSGVTPPAASSGIFGRGAGAGLIA